MNALPAKKTVLFEIDYVLACTDVQSVEEVAFFKKEGAIITAVKTHYVFPGVIELIRMLHERGDVEIGFYSQDVNQRNRIFARKLLKLALGKEKYRALKTHLIVLSAFDPKIQKTGVKDLSRLGNEVAVVDYTNKNILPDQASQVIWIPSTRAEDYREKGQIFKPIDSMILEQDELDPDLINEVKAGRCAVLQKTKGQIILHYLDKKRKRVSDFLAKEPDHEGVLKEVASRGGVVEQIGNRQNTVFFLAGLIPHLLKSRLTLTDAVKKELYQDDGKAKWLDHRFFKKGLRRLKRMNPSLDYMSHERVNAAYKEAMSDVLRRECQNLLTNRWARKRVFLDIDEVLSCHDVRNIKGVAFFARYGMIIHAVRSQYVFPGVKELLQALFAHGIEVGIYSAAPQERNIPYTNELMERSLGRTVEVPVLNKTVDFPAKVKQAEFNKFGKHTIEKHKDLKEALQPGEEIENNLIADDNPECAAPGQIRNLLVVPWTDGHKLEIDRYTNTLPFKVCDELQYYDADELCNGTSLIILLTKDREEVLFLDKTTQEIKSLKIVPPWLEDIKKNSKCYYEGQFLGEMRAIVDGLNGKTTQICRQLNVIYYLAGLLFTVIREAEETGETLAKTLFKRQFRKIKPGKYESIARIVSEDDSYYHLGLSILKKYNDALEFMTPDHVKACELAITPELKAQYEAHLNFGK